MKISNQQLQDRKNNAVARGEGNAATVYIERALNAEMWDVEGKRYIDFGAGIAVCNTGHMHPKIKAAVARQLDHFSHTCVMITPYEVSVALAEHLNRLVPGPTPKKSIFVTTGAEAVENAVKIARSHTGRRGAIAFHGGYHGRTLMTMGLTGKVTPYKNAFGPFPPEVFHVPFPINFHGITLDDTLRALEQTFLVDIAPTDVAALIVEPIQGEGGFYPAPPELLQSLRKICDRHGIVLIVDEIQTGFARTGKLFCTEYSGIEPDMITMAKGLAGGFPLAAVTGKAEIMDAPEPGGIGGTYAGSPIGCAAALAVIEIIEEENLIEKALHIGAKFKQRLEALQGEHPDVIGHIRCDHGAMMAVEMIHDGDSEKPNTEIIKTITTRAYDEGLVLIGCGSRGNVIRFLPPLTISDELINEGFDIFERCFKGAL